MQQTRVSYGPWSCCCLCHVQQLTYPADLLHVWLTDLSNVACVAGPYRSAQPPYPQHPVAPQQHELPEEADLTNLMCDECDFCTPPHSPAGACVLRDGCRNVPRPFPLCS